MDLSKLPKLSGQGHAGTPTAPPGLESPGVNLATRAPVPQDNLFASPGGALISVIIGIIFMFVGQNFAKWSLATASGQPFVTGWVWPNDGSARSGLPVSYWELETGTAWSDCGMFLFGLSALIDAAAVMICLRSQNPGMRAAVLRLGFGVTSLATLANLLACIKLFSLGTLPIFSLLAVGIGGYMLIERYPIIFGQKTGSPSQR